MGEFADYALDELADIDALQLNYQTFDEAVLAGCEELLYDYDGSRYPSVFSGKLNRKNPMAEVKKRRRRTTKSKAKKPKPESSVELLDLSTYDPGWLIILYGTQGVGKTSLATHMPNVYFMLHKNEASLISLIKKGLAPKIAIHPQLFTRADWDDLIAALYAFAEQDEYDHLAIDSLKWLEAMCFQYTIEQDYNGDESKFLAYSKGQKVSAPKHWEALIEAIQTVKASGKNIMMLAHAIEKFYNNPHGPDYDRTIVDMSERNLFDALQNSADAVLWLTPDITVEKGDGTKHKATGDGDDKQIITKGFGSYVAKEKLGLPYTIPLTEDPKECWQLLKDAIDN